MGGTAVDLNGKYFRSSWERNFARILNLWIEKGILLKWEYEPHRFEFPVKNKSGACSHYTPDFGVSINPEWIDEVDTILNHSTLNMFIEVKGYLDSTGKCKIKRMGTHFPDTTLVVVGIKEYKRLEKEYREQIGEWE